MTESEKEPLVCIVDRNTWARGGGSNSGLLMVNQDGTKCCLGFLGEQCGIPSERLHCAMPYGLSAQDVFKYPAPVYWHDFSIANDTTTLTDQQRELKLQELAQRAGFTFKFVG